MKVSRYPIRGILLGFDWDWEFKVIEIDLLFIGIMIVYGDIPEDTLFEKLTKG